MPCAYEQILLEYSAAFTSLMKALASPSNFATFGGGYAFSAARRCACAALICRASTAAAIVGTGTCSESASLIAHEPVPFMPTLS
jgi:hypothetical protein